MQGAWPIWKSVWITGQLEYLVLFDSCLYLVSSMNLNLSLKAIKVLLHSSVRDEIAVFLLDCVLYRSGKTDPTKEKLKKKCLRETSSPFPHGFSFTCLPSKLEVPLKTTVSWNETTFTVRSRLNKIKRKKLRWWFHDSPRHARVGSLHDKHVYRRRSQHARFVLYLTKRKKDLYTKW